MTSVGSSNDPRQQRVQKEGQVAKDNVHELLESSSFGNTHNNIGVKEYYFRDRTEILCRSAECFAKKEELSAQSLDRLKDVLTKVSNLNNEDFGDLVGKVKHVIAHVEYVRYHDTSLSSSLEEIDLRKIIADCARDYDIWLSARSGEKVEYPMETGHDIWQSSSPRDEAVKNIFDLYVEHSKEFTFIINEIDSMCDNLMSARAYALEHSQCTVIGKHLTDATPK